MRFRELYKSNAWFRVAFNSVLMFAIVLVASLLGKESAYGWDFVVKIGIILECFCISFISKHNKTWGIRVLDNLGL